MTLLATDDVFLQHDTGKHPECAARLEHVYARLDDSGLLKCVRLLSPIAAADDDLLLCHSAEYLASLRRVAEAGGGRVEGDTVMSKRSAEVARLAAGTLIDGVQRAARIRMDQAVRPAYSPDASARAARAPSSNDIQKSQRTLINETLLLSTNMY